MKIKRSSWHFRMYYWWYVKEPKNLCKYFWKYMVMLVSMVLVSPFVVMIIPFVCLWKGGKWLENRYPFLGVKVYNEDNPPIWLEYLRAKKDKVCPSIKIIE